MLLAGVTRAYTSDNRAGRVRLAVPVVHRKDVRNWLRSHSLAAHELIASDADGVFEFLV